MKFTEERDDGKICFEVSSFSTWPRALEVFEDFLRGCGYVIDGHFELVKNDKEDCSVYPD